MLVELVRERFPLEKLHDDVQAPIGESPAKKHPDEVRVVEHHREPGFALKPQYRLFVSRQLGPQDLDGDVAADRGLVSSIHGPHPTGSNLFIDAELLEKDGAQEGVRNLVIAYQEASVVGAVFGLANELRTAAKANLPHVGRLPWSPKGRSIWYWVVQFFLRTPGGPVSSLPAWARSLKSSAPCAPKETDAKGCRIVRIVGGRLSGRRFAAPGGRGTRPTPDRVREALASALESRGAFEDACVLDLFAGTGALSFEALSRGASQAVLVDSDSRAVRQITESARELGLASKVRTVRVSLAGDPVAAVRRLPEIDRPFDLVFADAPYSEIGSVPGLLEALVAFERLAPGAWIVVEHPSAHAWSWPNGLASDADYRYGRTSISLGTYSPEKGRH